MDILSWEIKELKYWSEISKINKIKMFLFSSICILIIFLIGSNGIHNKKMISVIWTLVPKKGNLNKLEDLYNRLERQINRASSGKRGLDAEGQKPLRITYDGMKAYLKRFGFDFAIRQYIPNRKNNQAVITYNRWPDIALCDFIDLEGTTVQQIRAMFSNR